MKCITAGIYESKRIGNCSNEGISSKYDTVTIEHKKGWIEPQDDMPLVIIKTKGDYVYAEPANKPKIGNVGWMSGGSFIYCSDSRFPYNYPIALHDRQETPEQYESLSK